MFWTLEAGCRQVVGDPAASGAPTSADRGRCAGPMIPAGTACSWPSTSQSWVTTWLAMVWNRCGDVDVAAGLDDLVVPPAQQLEPDGVVGVEEAPEVLPPVLNVADGALDGAERLVGEGVDLVIGDVLLEDPQRRDDAIEFALQEVGQRGVPRPGAGVGDLVLLHQHQHEADDPALGVLVGQLLVQDVREGDRHQRRAEHPDVARDGDHVAGVDVVDTEVAVAAVAGDDVASAAQLDVLADLDRLAVHLEGDRPQVRLGAADPVTLPDGVDPIDREPHPQRCPSHQRTSSRGIRPVGTHSDHEPRRPA